MNWLAAARLFLFGSRDAWFAVALPLFLTTTWGWGSPAVGGFLSAWVIGYGIVQASVPRLIRSSKAIGDPDGGTARRWALALALLPAGIAIALMQGLDPAWTLIIGLGLFGVVFAINSAVHSFLILAYADHDKVAMKVGFYYMANAGGRLLGTVLSGWVYQTQGLEGCLWWSVGFVVAAGVLSLKLPKSTKGELGSGK